MEVEIRWRNRSSVSINLQAYFVKINVSQTWKLCENTRSRRNAIILIGGIEEARIGGYFNIVADILCVIDCQLENIRIIGHSMGGTLALDIAAEIPDKVHRLVLVDAIPCMRDVMMPGVTADQIQYESPYNKQMLEMADEAFIQMARMMAGNMTNNDDKKEIIAQWSLQADRKTYVYGFTDLLKLDLRPSLSKITANALILGAPFPDKQVVLANFEKQYADLANKTIELAENSKHFIMFDQPEWFYEKVNVFLSR